MTTSTEQIAGETGALDLMRGYLAADPEAVVAAAAAGAVSPTAAACMRQRASGLLTESVLAGPDFFPCRRVVMGPADIEWLESIPMETAVAEAVLALAGDGATPRLALDDAQLATVFALSAVARCVAVYGREGTTNSLPSSVRRGP
ncbi:hypothetical protein GCM10010347_65560 [Streptomyces cirratus]|uniref:Uncharacterized protein n=1 Tax=Streptomyces cirratus TaxID=68187 RepID=A0ABQ3F5J8_9ACTN|nr:hypothetical protein [Streptomyces cirratus]GHB85500.1 hypothetical protein GCM10010347_65560 [Streptomyces cirratus]